MGAALFTALLVAVTVAVFAIGRHRYTISPTLLGVRAVLSFMLCVLFVYMGWLRDSVKR